MNIFIFKDGKQQGPFTVAEARRRCLEGKLAETDPAWHEGLGDWIPLNQVEGFSYLAPSAFAPPEMAPKNPGRTAPPKRAAEGFRPARANEAKRMAGAGALFAAWAVILFLLFFGSSLGIGAGLAATRESWSAPDPDFLKSFDRAWAMVQAYCADHRPVIFFRSALAGIVLAALIAFWAHAKNSVTDAFLFFRRFGPVGASILPTFLAFLLLTFISGMFVAGVFYGAGHPLVAGMSTNAARAWQKTAVDFLVKYRFTVFAGAVVAAFVITELLSLTTFLRGFESDISVFFKRLATTYLLFWIIFSVLGVLIYFGAALMGIHVAADEILSLGRHPASDADLQFQAKIDNVVVGYLAAIGAALLASLFFAFQIAFSDFFPWCRASSGPSRGRHRFRSAL